MENTKLEELIKNMDMGIPNSRQKEEFLNEFKESQLLMPVIFNEDLFEDLKNSKPDESFAPEGRLAFDINFLKREKDIKEVPLFTSEEMMESAGLESSAIAIFMSDLADMLEQANGKYSMIAINPFTNLSVDMPLDSFLNLFGDELMETLGVILAILKDKSVELEEDYAFFVRSGDDFMKEDAVGGVFTPQIPFNASSREDFKDDLKYLNILLMPKTKKILFIGNIVDEDHYDTIIAPGSEFHFVEDLDEYTRVWKCGNQQFYD
ncbi:MAG: SseB family protein [Methanobrevibacter sp.]|nr:SseB family protein [Methanobrevibacter sp.]